MLVGVQDVLQGLEIEYSPAWSCSQLQFWLASNLRIQCWRLLLSLYEMVVAANTIKKWRCFTFKASKNRGQTILPPLIASLTRQCTNTQGTLGMRQIMASCELLHVSDVHSLTAPQSTSGFSASSDISRDLLGNYTLHWSLLCGPRRSSLELADGCYKVDGGAGFGILIGALRSLHSKTMGIA